MLHSPVASLSTNGISLLVTIPDGGKDEGRHKMNKWEMTEAQPAAQTAPSGSLAHGLDPGTGGVRMVKDLDLGSNRNATINCHVWHKEPPEAGA